MIASQFLEKSHRYAERAAKWPMRHMAQICVILLPKISRFAAQITSFVPGISRQIAAVTKNHATAKAYAHRTPCRIMLRKWRIAAARKFAIAAGKSWEIQEIRVRHAVRLARRSRATTRFALGSCRGPKIQ